MPPARPTPVAGVAGGVVADLLGRSGRVDALINNAGFTSPKPFEELTKEDWDLVVGVHLKGSFNWSHAVAFLVSEKASYISGEALDVNGALYID